MNSFNRIWPLNIENCNEKVKKQLLQSFYCRPIDLYCFIGQSNVRNNPTQCRLL